MTKLLVPLLFLLGGTQAAAQILPLGLYEGLMANSGVATDQSTAASYYNPSLLRQRQDDAFSLNGNTLGTSNTKSGDSTISSSLSVAPSYLSTVLVGEALLHEFFLANTFQGKLSLQTTSNNNFYDAEMNMTRLVTGYSMAFKSIPFALQVLGRYSEIKTFGVSEFADTVNNIYSVTKIKSEFKNLNIALGLSSHFRFEHYTFGVNFNSRGWSIYNQNEGSYKNFAHGAPSPSDYIVTEGDSVSSSVSHEEGRLALGHSFRVGDHEFLTDSIFSEASDNLNRYTFIQTFGYRLGSPEEHQFLCGLGHTFGSEVDSIGQSLNASVGYSWRTRKLRSAVGLYYSRTSRDTTDSSAAGFVFGSEYEY